MITRRNLLHWLGVGTALAASGIVPSRVRRSLASPSSAPRNFLMILLQGGIDQILTTDPKTRSQIEPFVDRPYRDRDVITEAGVHLGPVLKPLRRHANRLTIVNAVLNATVSHQTGALQHSRLKIGNDLQMPSVVDLIGLHRDTQVLPSVTLGDADEYAYTSTWFGSGSKPGEPGLLDELGALTNEELRLLAAETERNSHAFAGNRGLRERIAMDNTSAAANLFRRLAEVPRFTPQKWSDDPVSQWYARSLQQASWLFEHDLTHAVYVRSGRNVFDTHSNNAELQALKGAQFFEMFARYLDELERAPARKPFVLVSSEVGRYPRINNNAGKDHFPEAPVIMYGPGLRPGQFVDTGRQTEAFPVDLQTGRRAKAGGHVVTLDDVGATVLELAGVEFSRYAHSGTPLPFCLAK